MSKQKRTMADILAAAPKSAEQAQTPVERPRTSVTSSMMRIVEELAVEKQKPKSYKAPSREGKRMVSFHVSEEVWQALTIAGVKKRKKLQAIGIEMINDFFEKEGLPTIAE